MYVLHDTYTLHVLYIFFIYILPVKPFVNYQFYDL